MVMLPPPPPVVVPPLWSVVCGLWFVDGKKMQGQQGKMCFRTKNVSFLYEMYIGESIFECLSDSIGKPTKTNQKSPKIKEIQGNPDHTIGGGTGCYWEAF